MILNEVAVGEIKTHERAKHVDIAVREVDQPQYTVNHGVSESDQRICTTLRHAVDELLKERFHQLRCDGFYELQLAVFDFQNHGRFNRIAILIDRDLTCNSFEFLR